MNPGQKMFYDFILDRVAIKDHDKAKSYLTESFERQANGSFDKAFLTLIQTKLLAIVKPEFLDEVKQAMNHFASQR